MALPLVISTSTWPLMAQSNRDLAAREALTVAPAMAAHPLMLAEDASIQLRYAAWKYYETEPIRSNAALSVTWSRGATLLGLTGTYVSRPCADCKTWIGAAVDVQRSVTPYLSLRANAGIGQPLKANGSSSASVAITAPLQMESGRIKLALHPGLIFGGIATRNTRLRTLRPIAGGSAAFCAAGWSANIGAQAAIHRGSAPVLGVGFAWTL